MIKKMGGKYIVVGLNHKKRSPDGTRSGRLGEKKTKTGKVRKFGTYTTLAEAKERLRQVEFFKHRAHK